MQGEFGSRDAHAALLVGVDGGATAVKACSVVPAGDGLVAGEDAATFRCDDGARAPVPLDEQRRALAAGHIEPTEDERAWGDAWIDAYVESIASVAARARRADLRVGICAPGLKTADGRGIALVRNGPRIPDFLDRLESRLSRAGLALVAPIPPLLSDGVACGLGEAVHPHGAFRGVRDAYYVGGGTGLAECLLLDGRVIGFDDVASRARKAWELVASSGRTFEDELSMRGLAERWERARTTARAGDARGRPASASTPGFADPRPQPPDVASASRSDARSPVRSAEEARHVEDAAAQGDPAALAVTRGAALALHELVRARAGVFPLERVVVGQRLGAWFAREDLREAWIEPARRGSPVPLVASTLREAPAIGAASRVLAGPVLNS